MNYISIDIRLGTVGSTRIEEQREKFYNEVANLLFPSQKSVCFGLNHSSSFDNCKIQYEPASIANIVENALEDCLGKNNFSLDLLLIDFSSDVFGALRDSILMSLGEKIEKIVSNFTETLFAIMVPYLPGRQTASMELFHKIQIESKRSAILLIANSGEYYLLPNDSTKVKIKEKEYSDLVTKLQADPLLRLKMKVVRKLGNFPIPRHSEKTRFYSYIIDNCDEELLSLLKTWWGKKGLDCDAIIYDTASSPSLTNAVRNFCIERELKCYRIEDILRKRSLSREVARNKFCLMVLDVVETGETLSNYGDSLKGLNVKVCNEVLAAINKGGETETVFNKYIVLLR